MQIDARNTQRIFSFTSVDMVEAHVKYGTFIIYEGGGRENVQACEEKVLNPHCDHKENLHNPLCLENNNHITYRPRQRIKF